MSHLPIVPAQCFAVAVRTGEPSSKEAMKKTLTEAELRQLITEGKTHAEIAKLIGRHPASVAATCYILGISKPRAEKRLNRAAEFYQELRKGATVREVAEKHGTSYTRVYMELRRAGLPTSPRAILRAQQAA